MSGKIRLILSGKKRIRGKEFAAGTVLIEGECAGDFTVEDIEKNIQTGALHVDPKLLDLKAAIKQKPAVPAK